MPSLAPARTPIGVGAAVLCLAVSWIHIQDQGGFPGSKTPTYVGLGYYLLEAAGVVCAALLLHPRTRSAAVSWLLAAGVAVGPLLGYLLSRGPGLPDYSDDKGNWTEPLGLVSLGVEGLLLLIAAAMLIAPRRTPGAPTATQARQSEVASSR
jgi:MFS family permease